MLYLRMLRGYTPDARLKNRRWAEDRESKQTDARNSDAISTAPR
jgi:hypothetical protein